MSIKWSQISEDWSGFLIRGIISLMTFTPSPYPWWVVTPVRDFPIKPKVVCFLFVYVGCEEDNGI